MLYTLYDSPHILELTELSKSGYLDPYSKKVYILTEFTECMAMSDDDLYDAVSDHIERGELTRTDAVLLLTAIKSGKWITVSSVAHERLLGVLKRTAMKYGIQQYDEVVRGSKTPNFDRCVNLSLKKILNNSSRYSDLLDNENFIMYLQRRERLIGPDIKTVSSLRKIVFGIHNDKKNIIYVANRCLKKGYPMAVKEMMDASDLAISDLEVGYCKDHETFVYMLDNCIADESIIPPCYRYTTLRASLSTNDVSRLSYLVNNYPEVVTGWDPNNSGDHFAVLSRMKRDILMGTVMTKSTSAFRRLSKLITYQMTNEDQDTVMCCAGCANDMEMFDVVLDVLSPTADNYFESLAHITDYNFVSEKLRLYVESAGISPTFDYLDGVDRMLMGMFTHGDDPSYYGHFIAIHSLMREYVTPEPSEYTIALELQMMVGGNIELMDIFYSHSDKLVDMEGIFDDQTKRYTEYNADTMSWIICTVETVDIGGMLCYASKEKDDDHKKIEKILSSMHHVAVTRPGADRYQITQYFTRMMDAAKIVRNHNIYWYVNSLTAMNWNDVEHDDVNG